jgi:hypothetical protein
MDLAEFREYCLTNPAQRGDTIRARCSRVQSRRQNVRASGLDEVPTTVNLKCDPDLALDLRDRTSKSDLGIT